MMRSSGQKNIEIEYLYRDGGNYKLFGSKVFTNKFCLSVNEILGKIEVALEDGLYFIPEKWGFERLSFEKMDLDLDHHWHEIESIEYSEKQSEDGEDIEELLARI